MDNREQQILSQIYKSQAQNVWCRDWTSRTMNGGRMTKRVCVHVCISESLKVRLCVARVIDFGGF